MADVAHNRSFGDDDPYGLRRFGFYDEPTARVEHFTETVVRLDPSSMVDPATLTRTSPRYDPSLDAFLRYWTPERIAARKREETTS